MQDESRAERNVVSKLLPWIVFLAALAVYVATLNHWVSFQNVSQVSRLADWTWSQEIGGPAFYIVTLPLKWLPAKWIPLALNFFSALCAAISLGQLARCVALLPHDRTHEQRQREMSDHSVLSVPLAWVPPVLAVLACAFQLSFWENATNGAAAMFDLLLFSFIVRSLLEFRVDGREGRLYRAAFVQGLAMTNNFAMVGYLPVFIIAIAWIRGLSFFSLRFLGRMILCGLAGLLLYLLLPLLAAKSNDPSMTFWFALKSNVINQYQLLRFFPKKMFVLLALTSLLPTLVMAIKWSSYFGDTSQIGVKFTTFMFHLAHAVILLACVWMLFDPPFGPRQVATKLPGYFAWIPFLSFYFLAALSIGYYSGYFLLVFRPKRTRGLQWPWLATFNKIATAAVLLLLVLVPAGLLLKNVPLIQRKNSSAIRDFAAATVGSLPESAALLSDDSLRLMLVRAGLADAGRERDYVFLDTRALYWPSYHRYLHEQYPKRWDAPKDTNLKRVSDTELLTRMLKLEKDLPVYYLHPSFGYYFEVFDAQPHGLVYALQRYPKGQLFPSKLSPELLAENEEFWARATNGFLKPILDATAPRQPGAKRTLRDWFLQKLRIPPEQSVKAKVFGPWHSRSVDAWAVELQRLGRLDEAASWFEMAQQLNPDNVVAYVNLLCNRNMAEGKPPAVQITKSLDETFGKYRNFQEVLNANGPYDEPTLCYIQGWLFLRGNLYREAGMMFQRVREFLTDDTPPGGAAPADAAIQARVMLGQIFLTADLPDKTLEIVEELRGQPNRFTLNSTNQADLLALEANAYYAQTETNKAREVLQTAMRSSTNAALFASTAMMVYLKQHDLTNGLAAANRLLEINPQDTSTLINRSWVQMSLEDVDGAIASLDRVIEIEPDVVTQPNSARAYLNRAIAYLRSDRLDKAKADYEHLNQAVPGIYQVNYGLAEIAWRQKDTNTAIHYYESYLTNAPPDSAEAKQVAQRLEQLKGGTSE